VMKRRGGSINGSPVIRSRTGKSMISHVNDTIERTHRLTGMPREEIVRRGLVRAEIPLYGLGGAMTMGALAGQDKLSPDYQ